MLKNDFKLIIWLLLFIGLLYAGFNLYSSKSANKALVYYDNNLIKTIDLSIDKTYTVEGYNGKVDIKVKDSKIRITKETSPLHICYYQGYISKASQVLVCLPNKIVIKIVNEKSTTDAIIK